MLAAHQSLTLQACHCSGLSHWSPDQGLTTYQDGEDHRPSDDPRMDALALMSQHLGSGQPGITSSGELG